MPVQQGVVNDLVEAESQVDAINGKISQVTAMCYQLNIQPSKLKVDSDKFEDVWISFIFLEKAAKQKKIQAFKSKVRFENLEVTQNKRFRMIGSNLRQLKSMLKSLLWFVLVIFPSDASLGHSTETGFPLHEQQHKTGCVIGCLRKIQNWCLPAVLEE
ncbi:hypothetical protein C5167_041235 [Papaver somniferum]|uniref:Uncharacterized protein n=1 Tax=Papaver somniferum TaxID=3469 RepID=A0A4Y7IHA6_PAPSO|nr:hypothetical protein C5167_041235 [Papaver somniferum]